jgi:hypothetical protein
MQADDNATLTLEAEAAQGDDKSPAPQPAQTTPDPYAFFEIYWPYFEQPIDQA